jgi:hypothetical protein
MKALTYLGASVLALTTFVAPLQADGSRTKEFDRVKSRVIQCGHGPDGQWRCETYDYDDGSDCMIIDIEGAPGGTYTHGCGRNEQ